MILQDIQKDFSQSNKLPQQNSKIAVKNLSLGINRGEIFGLLGPNGAGKSTTIS